MADWYSQDEASFSDDATVEVLLNRLQNAASGSQYKPVAMEASEIDYVLDVIKAILMSRPMLLEISAPTRVFGDLHGQFFDLLQVFELTGDPSTTNQMLFLGDYVDRGMFGIETVLILFCFKIRFPDHVHLLRGNHEARSVSRVYGFYEECSKRFNPSMWKKFMEVFDCLPVACIISKAIICMHGGLSPHLTSLNAIRKISRPCDVPPGGLMADLLWSDPDKKLTTGWAENPRGVSFIFAKDVVDTFLNKFNLDLIIRAHQVVYYGYELFADSKLVTLFTAPNFCGTFQNMGCMIHIDKKLKLTMMFLDSRQKNRNKSRKSKKPKEEKSQDDSVAKTSMSSRGTTGNKRRARGSIKRQKSNKELGDQQTKGTGSARQKRVGSSKETLGKPGQRGGSSRAGSPKDKSSSSRSCTPKQGSRRDVTPAKGSRRDVTPAKGSRRDVTPAKGSRRDVTPAPGSRRDVTPAKGSRRDLTHAKGSRRDVTPATGSRRDVTPATGSRRDVTPAKDNGRDVTPAKGSSRDVTPKKSIRSKAKKDMLKQSGGKGTQDTKTVPAEPDADTKTTDTKTTDMKTADMKTADMKTADMKTTDMKAAETNGAETKTAETKAAETKAAETKAAETKAAETKAAKPKAAETKTADAKNKAKSTKPAADTKSQFGSLFSFPWKW